MLKVLKGKSLEQKGVPSDEGEALAKCQWSAWERVCTVASVWPTNFDLNDCLWQVNFMSIKVSNLPELLAWWRHHLWSRRTHGGQDMDDELQYSHKMRGRHACTEGFKSVYYKVRWTVITNCESFLITKCNMVNYRHFDISYPYITFQETPFPTAAAGVHWEVCQHSWAFSPTNSRYIRMILTPDIHTDIWNFSAIAQVFKSSQTATSNDKNAPPRHVCFYC